MAKRDIQLTSQTRIFTMEGGAGPGATAVYQGLGRALGPDWAGGDVTPIRAPSRFRYRDFEIVEKTIGQKGLPTMSLEMLMRRDLSDMLTLFQKGCPVDIQIHAGACQDPTDFLSFDVAYVLEAAQMTNYSTGELGSFDGEDPTTETLPFTGDDFYQIVAIRDSEVGASEIVQEIVGLSICDAVSCGECGVPSDGTQVVFMVTKSHGGSPGTAAEVIFTDDAGNSLGSTIIDTLGSDEDPTDLACVGTNLVVISGEDLALHYAPISDILAEDESWTRVATGFVAAKTPNRILSRSRTLTWIVAEGGYIYFSADITAGVTVQTAGSLTVQGLNDIAAVDDLNLVAVGDSNAVLYSRDGGNQWQSVTGPNVGVNLGSVAMRTPNQWIIGDAGGNLWYTEDAGLSWSASSFTGSGAGVVSAIVFATSAVGYLSHTLSGRGYVLRTIDGGATWFRLPGGGTNVTDNDRLNRLAVAPSAPSNIRANLVWAAGLAANAVDGIALKIAA